MKHISRQFKTFQQAESYQMRLYDKFRLVRLVRSPFFGNGLYIWEVAK